MDNELSKAYSEVDKILSFMENRYIEKVPYKLRELIKNKKLEGYEPEIKANIPLNKQNIQRKTLSILAMLNLNYWCDSEEEKQELILLYAENDKKREERIREIYNPNNLFKKKELINEDDKPQQENTNLVEYKEQNIFKKILDKIMKLFKKYK